MNAFWDTSAVLALVFQEPHTTRAQRAAAETTIAYAWWWLEVEAWSGVLRRRGNAAQEEACRRALTAFAWVNFPRSRNTDLLSFNRRHRLRAADAGHLFCCQELGRGVENIVLVSFDREMVKAAEKEGMTIWH